MLFEDPARQEQFGSVLDDLMGYLGGGGNLADGAGILGHVLGAADVEEGLVRAGEAGLGQVLGGNPRPVIRNAQED